MVALGLAAFVAVRASTHRPRADAAPAAGAPALSLPDLSGREVTLASLRGRAVAVNFWASWCPPCRSEIPELSAFYRENRDRCFELLGVAEDSGGRDEVARAAAALGVGYPVLLDRGGSAATRFGVGGLPHTVVLDRDGNVRRVFVGAIGRSELERALGPLLAAPGAPCPRA
jgi:cytochrome c biogenesis protein CcmG/thiol:disulfide interchange protein DsbE